ncbi:MAG: hypothetical protein AAFY15_12255 [Cyanobacteria bacterium J06648_11]
MTSVRKYPERSPSQTIRELVDRALRTKVLTRDQRDALDTLVERNRLAQEDLCALQSLQSALANKDILTYPDLCL